MKPQTVAALLALNRQFYARFAGEFSRTRRSWPPGFSRILPYLKSGFNVLDLGCGNGRLLVFLGESGWTGHYLGLDSSEGLLADATAVAARQPSTASAFLLADLFADGWAAEAASRGPFDVLVSLAVLHHIPGREHRIAFLARCKEVMPRGAPLIVSTWQFMRSERLKKRLVPWEAAGIDLGEVERNDYLVGWGEGSPGARYCAYIDEPELKSMAAEAGLTMPEAFSSDGHEGNLNLYAVLTR
jgi:tRNA (uracil-5-)-methyltransferase TRM9